MSVTEENEQIEPIDEVNDAPYQHIKERKVVIQPYDYAVRSLMDMIIDGDLKLDPDYQRKYQWDDVKASRFIESIALNIPVPVIYLAEENDGSLSVIDGQQRLTSLFRFIKESEINDVFPDSTLLPLELEGLKILKEINQKKYTNLDREIKSTISKRPIRCIVVLSESDEALKFEVFERLNTGSASLKDQEIRNCVYRGGFNDLLKRLATNEKFVELTSLPEQDAKSMKGVELVLRFFSYSQLAPTSTYSDNYSEYLNMFMEDNRNITTEQTNRYETIFRNTIDIIYETLGPGVAFRKPLDRSNIESSRFAHTLINGAIYESQMVAVSRMIEKGDFDKVKVRERIFNTFQNEEYWGALFQGTAKKAKAIKRSAILTDQLLKG